MHNNLFVQGYLAILCFQYIYAHAPPLYPCHNPFSPLDIREGYWSPNWFIEDHDHWDITWPTDDGSLGMHDEGVFAGVGPTQSIFTLSVTNTQFQIVSSSSNQNVIKTLLELTADAVGGVGIPGTPHFTGAGFLPIDGDEYAWLTLNGVASAPRRVQWYVVHIPTLLGGYPSYAYGVMNPSGHSVADVFGCSFGDRIGGPGMVIATACLVRRDYAVPTRATIFKQDWTINYYDGAWAVVPTDDFHFDTNLVDPNQNYPIYLSVTSGHFSKGSIYYRCSAGVGVSDRVWCRTKYNDKYNPATSDEEKFLTSEHVVPNTAGRFIGGITHNDAAVYFLNTKYQILYLLHTSEGLRVPYFGGQISFGSTATVFGVVTGGIATTLYHDHTADFQFRLSGKFRV
jgi:hypothetical protein